MSDAKTVRRTVSGVQAAGLGLLAAALVAPFYVDAFGVQVGGFVRVAARRVGKRLDGEDRKQRSHERQCRQHGEQSENQDDAVGQLQGPEQ